MLKERKWTKHEWNKKWIGQCTPRFFPHAPEIGRRWVFGHHSCAFSRRCAKSACRICYASVHRGCTDHCNCTTESKPLVASTILWRSLWAIHRWSETDWSTPIKRPAILVSFFSVSYNSNLRTLIRHHVKRGKVFHTALPTENMPRKKTAYAKTR